LRKKVTAPGHKRCDHLHNNIWRPKPMSKLIVAGDHVCDNNIVHYLASPAVHHQLPSKTMLRQRPGGATYLKDIIHLAVSDLGDSDWPDANDENLCAKESSAPKVYQVWAPYEKESESKDKVWRIHELLGCEKTSEKAELQLPKHPEGQCILVLDNLGMGGFNNIANLEKFLNAGAKDSPDRIVLKTSSLMVDTSLLSYLIKNHADRLTVVLSVRTLRERGAAISEGLSWDRTIEDTLKEFKHGLSATDLAKCERVVVQFGLEGAASFSRRMLKFQNAENKPKVETREHVSLEHFLYHPREHEGSFRAKRPGTVFGAMSMITASVVRHMLRPEDYPLFGALGRALAAARVSHELGGGKEKDPFNTDTAHEAIKNAFHTAADAKEKPEDTFASAFNHELLKGADCQTFCSDLLQDVTGSGFEYVAAKALEVIYDGAEKALRYAPMACYGDYITADREEIERINSVGNLISQYRKNVKDARPLSLAVFGPPGSGKSFAIKQLAKELFGKDKKPLEFNLSQFGGKLENLHDAFHVVRDASIKGQVPLVFWDEFDSDDLAWLKEFLAPMQDAEFRSGSLTHPFGKAIFVFAGGTKSTFEAFDRSEDKDDKTKNGFKMVKGPDFVSRLRGFVNVKGPNPVEKLNDGEKAGDVPQEELANREPAHLIRRAMLLRSIIERQRPQLIGSDKKALIGSDVVRGFLRVEKFKHGARSLESVISMSNLADAGSFGGASLPNPDLLRLHVTDDFLGHVRQGQLDSLLKEALAEACHEAWRTLKTKQGWKYGAPTSRAKMEHDRLTEYSKLTEQGKDDNRLTAKLTEAKLRNIGYVVNRSTAEGEAGKEVLKFTDEERAELMIIEHDIWLRNHLIKGYAWAETSRDELRLHMDVAPFHNMPDAEKDFDAAIVDTIIPVLKDKGYSLVRA